MSLARLILAFVRRHAWAYASAGLTLFGIALLTVWLPRQIGHLVDALVQHRLDRATLVWELGRLLLAGVVIYGLRVAGGCSFGAAYQMGVELRARLYRRLALQGRASSRRAAPAT
jgi:ATP-binding cassette subfamily B protein/ATP-binding cassette subfamily C protein/ATP-binding cassette subfamily B multidrug efflux pump